MTYTAIPEEELDVFSSLEGIKVVFDVGARDDVDYLIRKPDIQLHAFEPNPVFFEELKVNVKGRNNVFINNCGLGDVEGNFAYNDGSQSIGEPAESGVTIKRLDKYVKEHGIDQIDFLKIDTEGYEYRILLGAGEAVLQKCRYIQYETGKDDTLIQDLLEKSGFELDYIGGRNMMCTRRGEKKPSLPAELKEGGLVEKTSKNYL